MVLFKNYLLPLYLLFTIIREAKNRTTTVPYELQSLLVSLFFSSSQDLLRVSVRVAGPVLEKVLVWIESDR